VITTASAQSTPIPCTTRTTSQYFSPWGDTNPYFLVPGSDFQASDTYPWTAAGGATRVSNGDPWNVMHVASPASASIPLGGSETSMQFCVTSTETWVRFFYLSPGVTGSTLHVTINVSNGTTTATNSWSQSGQLKGWQVSPVVNLTANYNSSDQEFITMTANVSGSAATWQLDDAMVDPFASL
jgi:hypothetical protein